MHAPSYGASLSIRQLCHRPSIGEATASLPFLTSTDCQASWWGEIGSVFVVLMSKFTWTLWCKIWVRSFYCSKPPQDIDFELFVFVSDTFSNFVLFYTVATGIKLEKMTNTIRDKTSFLVPIKPIILFGRFVIISLWYCFDIKNIMEHTSYCTHIC